MSAKTLAFSRMMFPPSMVRATCSRKIEHCRKLKARLGYNGPIKPNDPLIMIRRHDHVHLLQMCQSRHIMTKVIKCMDRVFISKPCKHDTLYSKMYRYFDGDRTIQGLEYFCRNYEVVRKAEKCMKAPNDELNKCRREQVTVVGERIQHGMVDQNLVCTATIAKIDCVRDHLASTCGSRVVSILAHTMALSMPRSCDAYHVLEEAAAAPAATPRIHWATMSAILATIITLFPR